MVDKVIVTDFISKYETYSWKQSDANKRKLVDAINALEKADTPLIKDEDWRYTKENGEPYVDHKGEEYLDNDWWFKLGRYWEPRIPPMWSILSPASWLYKIEANRQLSYAGDPMKVDLLTTYKDLYESLTGWTYRTKDIV